MVVGPLFLWTERELWRHTSLLDKLRELRGAAPLPISGQTGKETG
jgi:hypothetical protein